MAEVVKEGVLEVQKKGKLAGKKWKAVYAVLTPGGVHLFKNSNDLHPAKSINLESATLGPDKDKSRPSFSVKSSSEGLIVFACEGENDSALWVDAIKQSLGKKMTPPPPRPPAEHREGKESILFRAKKNLSGKMASSSLVKNQAMNEETKQLLAALATVVEKVTDAKTAAHVEKQLIKMMLKGYFQFERGSFTMEDFRPIDAVIRRAFNQMDKLFAHYQVKPASQLTEGFTKTSGMLQEASVAVLTLLGRYVRRENIAMMREALAVVTNAEFLFKVWDCAAVEDDLLSLVSAMNKYTQIEI